MIEPEGFDLLAIMAGALEDAPTETAAPVRLMEDHAAFVHEALEQVFGDPRAELDLTVEADSSFLAFAPPADLQRRLSVLPQSYLTERSVMERLRLTTDREVAAEKLEEAQRADDTQWPDTGYLGEQHPVVEWLTDKVLAAYPRGHAPVFVANVPRPIILLLAQCSNGRGQATVVEWLAAERTASGEIHVGALAPTLANAGIRPGMINVGTEPNLSEIQELLPDAIASATDYVAARRAAQEEELRTELATMRERARNFEELALSLATRSAEREGAQRVRTEAEGLADRLESTGEPLLRVVGAIVAP